MSRPRRRTPAAGRARRVVLLAWLVASGCVNDDALPMAPPRLSIDEPSHRFGAVAQGAAVEHTFWFRNTGGAPLTIADLRTACDTVATLVGGSTIAPGDGGALKVRFDTSAAHGPQRRTVTLSSNDPAQRATLLSLEGDVALDVAAEPSRLYLGTVPPGMPLLREIELLSGDGARFSAPTTDAAQLSIHLLDTQAGLRLIVGTAPGAPPGPFSATVRVPTTSAKYPVLRIEVAGTVAAAAAGEGQPPADADGNGRAPRDGQ